MVQEINLEKNRINGLLLILGCLVVYILYNYYAKEIPFTLFVPIIFFWISMIIAGLIMIVTSFTMKK